MTPSGLSVWMTIACVSCVVSVASTNVLVVFRHCLTCAKFQLFYGMITFASDRTRSRRIPHTSPLRHRFTEHGIYAIYVSDTQTHLADDEVCIILVEESVEDVTMVIHPELRYVAMGVPVKATLKVGKGLLRLCRKRSVPVDFSLACCFAIVTRNKIILFFSLYCLQAPILL